MSTQQTTLHDFTLNLLADPAARLAFQQDPEGVLGDAGLGDITAGDVYDILPLVLDSASIVKVDAVDKVIAEAGDITAVDHLKLITDNLNGVAPVTDIVATTGITAVVKDFADVSDVSSTLDAVVQQNDVVAKVTDNEIITKVTDNSVLTKVTDVADVDVHDIDALTGDVVAKTAVLNDIEAITGDVDGTLKAHDLVNVGDTVVQDVAQVGDVHVADTVGDITVGEIGHVGDVLDGGVGNGNDIDLHF
ncbi:hypothetical protein Lesp02_67690 [Lentzea sp. NBRC 105346]|uniref:IniB N-terminal domain-containing protein n=1 Tax=Lentzea sp. NBRC 105346 TaxID=3032205 RepID=UPI0024A492C3|nr:IniB N-terminal domain-containing protein [Lentzea sp. NBRC 105346]GLZ34582.1 hypothetical protein Lesp02_67690 [Lentzea sp. NBRC 105346]